MCSRLWKERIGVEVDQTRLIAEVKKRPGLWSVEHPVDRDEKLKLWKQVGAVMFSDWDKINKAKTYDRILFLQQKWRSFRDAYRRELRAQCSGKRTQKTVYRYFRLLKFLGGLNQSRRGYALDTSVNEQEEEPNNDSTENIEDNEDMVEETLELEEERLEMPDDESDGDDPLISSVVSIAKPKTIKTKTLRIKPKKRKLRTPSLEDADHVEEQEEVDLPVYSIDVREREREGVMDSDRLFLLSFLPEMKQLPMNIKMWARSRIANVMQEAVTCQYNNTNPEGLRTVKQQRRDSLQ